MKKHVAVILLAIVAISILIMLVKILPFTLTPIPSGTIKVVDNYGSAVAGATLRAIATEGTFHLLGDVFNSVSMLPELDFKIDDYDVMYVQGYYGQVNVRWADMNGDGKIDVKDISWISQNRGLTLENTLTYGVTDVDGSCILEFYDIIHQNEVPCYTVTVSKRPEIIDRTTNINMRSGGTITVEKNKPPEAIIDHYPTVPTVGATVTFDGSHSYDLDGSIVSYSWTIYDGTTVKTVTGATFTYVFKNYGDNTVSLTVTDDYGLTATKSIIVHVNAITVVAKISVDKTSGYAPLTVNFDGSGSYDPDGGTIISYYWDFGDGATANGVSVTHVYYNAGAYTITLTVIDDENTSGSASITIFVSPIEYGYASFTWTPSVPYANETVTFDASTSKPSSGSTIKEYHWTIDGYSTVTTVPIFTYTFRTTGSHTVKLYIVDSTPYTSPEVSKTVVVNEPIKADFTYSGELKVNSLITFMFTGKGSITNYAWDFGDGSTLNTNSPSVSHKYTSANTYNVKLTVTDGRSTDTTAKSITIIYEITVDCLTLLEFPPSANVDVKLLAKDVATGKTVSGISLTLIIEPKGTYTGFTKSGITGSDGTTTITILTPSRSQDSPYNMTVLYENKVVKCFSLKVLPQLAIKQISFSTEQIYKPGDFDFVYKGSIVNRETDEPVLYVSASTISLTDEKGVQVSNDYILYQASGNSFTLQAKVFDFYKSINPSFNYETHTLTLKITFKKTGWISTELTATAKMTPPSVVAIISPTSIPIGSNKIIIAFKDKYNQPYKGISENNIEVIITDPDGVSMTTANELKDRYTFSDADKSITIVYSFNKIGTYKVIVKYSGLPFYQEPQVFNISTYETPSIPPLLTNPYFIGFVALIVLAILLRRRKH
ncbi:MAG: PKD domain-containing protein [Candidatus Bathyarchaeota archaeon]